jgi:Flp pilus assembly protein protease CpaA
VIFKGQVFIYVLNEIPLMLEALLLTIALVLLVVGAYSDIRTREVPDWVNFSGIVAGLGIRAVWGFTENDWSALGWGVLGFVVFFAIAIGMYYTGQWGGGDSKLLMAMGAILGLEFARSSPGISFLIWVVLAGALYGVVCSVYLALKNWKVFSSKYSEIFSTAKRVQIPVLLVLVFGFAFAIATDDVLFRILMLVIALAVPVLFYTAVGIKAVEKCCMYKTIPTSRLTEGDWIARQVKVKGEYICGPKDLGITKEQIAKLKKMKVKEVLVREGIPFVPSFLIAFLLYLWLGNPLRWFL